MRWVYASIIVFMPAVGACASGRAATTEARAATTEVRAIALPDAQPAGVYMDYLAYDSANDRVWVPAGNTASVDVIDAKSGKISQVKGFVTQEMERNGKKRVVGPSSAAVGEGAVYIGNRGDFSVCAIAEESLEKGACITLDAMPDALVYVASTKEVWVTTPRDKSIRILDVAAPSSITAKTKLSFDGEPEGFALDEPRGLFYTNLEDKDRTLAIDLATHKTVHTWLPGCGESGPKGLAVDHAQNYVIVACADRIKVLNASEDGKELSSIGTGAGVDDIAYVEAEHKVYVGAAQAAKLTIAALEAGGKLTVLSEVPTAQGARNAVVTAGGDVYLTNSPAGGLLLIKASSTPQAQ